MNLRGSPLYSKEHTNGTSNAQQGCSVSVFRDSLHNYTLNLSISSNEHWTLFLNKSEFLDYLEHFFGINWWI